MSRQRWFPDDMPPPGANRETLAWWQAAAEQFGERKDVVDGALGDKQDAPRPDPAAMKTTGSTTTQQGVRTDV